MRLLFLYLFFTGFLILKVYSQSAHSNNRFIINGKIIGTDTGSVILWHENKNNKGVADTCRLINGKFHFSGTVNQDCEALIWTDVKNRTFDDSSVIRFLLEPNNMYVSYKPHSGLNPIITGSKSQTEKEKWDKQKSFLLLAKAQIHKSIDSLFEFSKANGNSIFQNQIDRLYLKRDSILESIKALDVEYIKRHSDSYLSVYLLSIQSTKLPVDSVEVYFNALAKYIKKSDLGHKVLQAVYPLTDDNEFRKENPLVDFKFDQRLSKIHSIYDLSLKDTSGNVVKLNSFKTKYIVIDFWASWCKPCVANIPFLEQIMNDYKSDSVQFISISLDKNVDNWKQSLIKHNFSGVQLSDLTGFNSLAAIYCKVIYVPIYIVADKNGKIINYDAPQPVDPKLKTLLDNLLKQN